MAVNSYPAVSSSKTAYRLTLLSGTSWTVPTGVTYINATLVGAGGGGGGGYATSGDFTCGLDGLGGQIVESTFATTPGASITYSLGTGGTAGPLGTKGGNGGSTTMTGATSASGGLGGMGAVDSNGNAGNAGLTANNGGGGGGANPGTGGAGGAGSIIIEYYA